MAAPGLLASSTLGASPISNNAFETGSPMHCFASMGPLTLVGRIERKSLQQQESARGRCRRRPGRNRLQLQTSVLYSWEDWRSSWRKWALTKCRKGQRQRYRSLIVVDEIAGQYEDNFDDVDKHLGDYFTFKAVKTVLAQLYEMNPAQYIWFYSFVVKNKPQDGKQFLRELVKARQELGERVMVTRLHLFNKWMKQYDHANMHKYISDDNLEVLRERLTQTVKFAGEEEDVGGPS